MKRKNREKNLKKNKLEDCIRHLFAVISILYCVWIAMSFIDINAKNGIGQKHDYWKYNFFTIDFGGNN